MVRTTALVAAIVASAAPSYAQEVSHLNSGNGLLAQCTAKDETLMFCMGRLDGIGQGYSMGLATQQQDFCIPAGVTTGQIKDMVVKHLQANPERRHLHWSLSVMIVLTEAFPCPGGRKWKYGDSETRTAK